MTYSWLHEELERCNLWGKFTVDCHLKSIVCIVVILCVFVVLCVHCWFWFFYLFIFLIYFFYLIFFKDAELLARSQYSEGPATGHLDTGFSWFLCVYKQMLRWFPRFQVATTCFSCSPPKNKSSSNQFHVLFTCKITTATR